MDDFDEFIELMGTETDPHFKQCQRLDWIGTTDAGLCPYVVATGNYNKSALQCFRCQKHFVRCDCGDGLEVGGGMICVRVAHLECPRLADPSDDQD
jgi:hypothetical protein